MNPALTDTDCYDSVTKVLGAFLDFSDIPEDIMKKKQDIGTRVHSSIEAYNKGLGVIIDNDDISGYLDSFLKWQKGTNKIVACEQKLCCDLYKIKGQIDMVLEVEGENVLYDVKTSSSMHKHYELQLSAYAYLCSRNGIEVKKYAVLLLNKDGKEPQEFYVEDKFNLFLNCLDVYRYFTLYMK